MKVSLCFIIFVLFSVRVEADFILAPETLVPGGVALLCWQGTETPHELLQVTFSGTAQPLLQRDHRPCALVGVDLDQAPGLWPLTVESLSPAGIRHQSQLSLRIEEVERPAQKLTLPKQMVTPTETRIVQQIERDRKRLNQVFKRRQPIHFAPPFIRPVEGEVISTFGLRRVLNGIPKSPHNGVDFRGPTGTMVKAMARGEVALADDLYYAGKTVILDHGGGLFSLYAHLDSLSVTTGEMIEPAKKIGTIGSTGRSTGPHLHVGTRLGKARIDPLALLALFSDEKR